MTLTGSVLYLDGGEEFNQRRKNKAERNLTSYESEIIK